ncbi:MAG: PAS domain-containing protein [Cyanobacteria bacterium SBLK]|nr:PAS domain-containing protein [Cyanobacteria bacterium SBLK]
MLKISQKNESSRDRDSFSSLGDIQKIPFSVDILPLYCYIFDALDEAVAIADLYKTDCPLVYCNRTFEKMLGYSRSEAIGKPFFFLQREEIEAETIAELQIAIREGREQKC